MTSLLLLSGGLDSALCLHRYGAALAVGFDYAQEHRIELDYAEVIADHYQVPFERHMITAIPKIDDVVYAGRNAILLSLGAAIAQQQGLGSVMIGCNFTDAMRFPDCLPQFIKALSGAYKDAYGVSVHAPLLTTSKAQIVAEAKAARLPETWTCYHPKDGRACGECYACKGRA